MNDALFNVFPIYTGGLEFKNSRLAIYKIFNLSKLTLISNESETI